MAKKKWSSSEEGDRDGDGHLGEEGDGDGHRGEEGDVDGDGHQGG